MKCKNCGKDIEEYEMFCDKCRKELKDASSKKDVNELENLIKENQKMNELENTKELEDLSTLVSEAIENDIKEQNTKEEFENDKLENKEEISQKNNHKKKKLIIIIISIVAIIILGLILVLLFLNNKDDEDKQENIIDYENVINEYGKHAEKTVMDYLNENTEIPTWQQVSELIVYKSYEVVCDTHNIYSDGSIYLNNCKVNGKKTNYSYGEEKEEIKEGKKIEVYKLSYDGGYSSYSNTSQNDSNLVGFITCKTDNCEFVSAYDQYVLIQEEKAYYIYNYENNSLEFGPFNLDNEYSYLNNLLVHNNTLYGVYYNVDGKNNIYNIKTGKTLKDLKGTLVSSSIGYDASIIYKYNYAILINNNGNNFINLNTGNISYTIKENLGMITEDAKNNIVYITVYTNDYNKFKIYNSNGKLLFDGKEFSKFKITDGNLIVANEKNYKVYDSNLNLKLSSKNYDEILGLYDDFIVVLDNNHLEILDLNDKILATFEEEWDKDNFYFHSMISGWYTDNGKYGIYLVVENKDIPYGTKGSGMEYYYIPTTKETGVIETEGVGGYAKPVLYLYPEKKTNITVTFANTSLLTTTYPKFKDNWAVTAYPNGDLYDNKGNYYYALYWEEEKNHYVDFSEGFYVTKDNAIEFLEEKLSIIGLNSKERNEFIMYWLPILEKNGKSLVYFELTEERDLYNKLIVNPKPDSILRVAIHVKKVNKKTSIKEEILTTFDRKGFTAVEWGGVIY